MKHLTRLFHSRIFQKLKNLWNLKIDWKYEFNLPTNLKGNFLNVTNNKKYARTFKIMLYQILWNWRSECTSMLKLCSWTDFKIYQLFWWGQSRINKKEELQLYSNIFYFDDNLTSIISKPNIFVISLSISSIGLALLVGLNSILINVDFFAILFISFFR